MSSSTFTTLGLSEPLLRALAKERFVQPTPIQASAIPHLLAGHDLLGIAQTGTGKTAAFVLPMLQHLSSIPARPAPFVTRALILALAASFPINQITHRVQEALAHTPGWADVKIYIASARSQAETLWSEVDLPEVPSLEEVRRYALERLAQTPSLEEIAVRARERLLELIHVRLNEAAASPAT